MDTNQNTSKTESGFDLFRSQYSKESANNQKPAQATGETDKTGAFELWTRAYVKPAEDTSPKGLSPEELQGIPGEIRHDVNGVYKKISQVFKDAGIQVDVTDPEWMMIASEIENAEGSLSKTLLSAQNAAKEKRNRMRSLSTREIIDNTYR